MEALFGLNHIFPNSKFGLRASEFTEHTAAEADIGSILDVCRKDVRRAEMKRALFTHFLTQKSTLLSTL